MVQDLPSVTGSQSHAPIKDSFTTFVVKLLVENGVPTNTWMEGGTEAYSSSTHRSLRSYLERMIMPDGTSASPADVSALWDWIKWAAKGKSSPLSRFIAFNPYGGSVQVYGKTSKEKVSWILFNPAGIPSPLPAFPLSPTRSNDQWLMPPSDACLLTWFRIQSRDHKLPPPLLPRHLLLDAIARGSSSPSLRAFSFHLNASETGMEATIKQQGWVNRLSVPAKRVVFAGRPRDCGINVSISILASPLGVDCIKSLSEAGCGRIEEVDNHPVLVITSPEESLHLLETISSLGICPGRQVSDDYFEGFGHLVQKEGVDLNSCGYSISPRAEEIAAAVQYLRDEAPYGTTGGLKRGKQGRSSSCGSSTGPPLTDLMTATYSSRNGRWFVRALACTLLVGVLSLVAVGTCVAGSASSVEGASLPGAATRNIGLGARLSFLQQQANMEAVRGGHFVCSQCRSCWRDVVKKRSSRLADVVNRHQLYTNPNKIPSELKDKWKRMSWSVNKMRTRYKALRKNHSKLQAEIKAERFRSMRERDRIVVTDPNLLHDFGAIYEILQQKVWW